MKLLIRADANTMIASGHIQRCLSIADAIAQEDVEVVFVSSEVEAKQVLAGKKYRCIILENDYREKDNEIPLLVELIQKENADGILVDSYEITNEYLYELAKKCPLAYIATMKNIEFSGDLLINYTQYSKQKYFEEKYSEMQKKGFLLQGERYVPLRGEFQNISQRTRKKIEKILITTGGSDPDEMSFEILMECISHKKLQDMQYTVVVGNYFQHVDKLEELVKRCSKVELKCNVKNMSELMKTHDMAVSAGGTTLFELCACGLPTVSFAMADNQIPMTTYFEEKGIIPYAGDERQNKVEVVQKVVNQFEYWITHIDEINEMSMKMSSLVDGLGAKRIAEKIVDMMSDERLKEACEKDKDLLLDWANEKKVREASFCSETITREQHEKWFQKVLNSNDILQFIFYKGNIPIGQIRLEKEQESAIISYSIAKEHRGKGYGKGMVEMLEKEVQKNHPEILELQAFVKKDNIASQKVFEGLGYQKSDDRYRKRM